MTKPFIGKVATESPKTVTTAAGAVYRKSDTKEYTRVSTKSTPKEGLYQKEKAKNPLEEPKSKHQKKDAEQNDDTESEDEDQNISSKQVKDLFQDSETVVTSRETPTGGGLNLAVKRAKPNHGGPTTMGPKTQDQVALKSLGETKGQNEVTMKSKSKSDKKKAAVTAEEARTSEQLETIIPPDQPSSSGGLANTQAKPSKKRITRDTSPSSILNAFQNQDMAPEEWQSLADQVLTRGLQRTAEEIVKSRAENQTETTGEHCSPTGVSDDSIVDEQTGMSVRRSKRATKNQGPKRLGSPVKHSEKYISTGEEVADLNEMALEQYRFSLANVKTDKNKPMETRLKLLERHLFRKKFGYDALDTTHPWKNQWKVPLEIKKPAK